MPRGRLGIPPFGHPLVPSKFWINMNWDVFLSHACKNLWNLNYCQYHIEFPSLIVLCTNFGSTCWSQKLIHEILRASDGNRIFIQIGVTHVMVSSFLQVGGNESHIHYYLAPRRLARTTSIRHDCLSFFFAEQTWYVDHHHIKSCL